jgi:hypothetical protein
MNDETVMADSFVVRKRRLRIYRIRQKGKATVLCLSRDDALSYLKDMQARRLRARQGQ